MTSENGSRAGMALAGFLLALGAMASPTPASAGFFDACLAPGDRTITVNQNTIVRNETAALPSASTLASCVVEVADGVTLRLIDVKIPATSKRLAFAGAGTSRLFVEGSNIRACDGDVGGFAFVQIRDSVMSDPSGVAGPLCDMKEIRTYGAVRIIGSSLQAFESPGETLYVRSTYDRVYIAKTSLAAARIAVATSAATAKLGLFGSTLLAGQSIDVTGAGPTEVIGNAISSEGDVTVTGDPCVARGNSSGVACAPAP